MFAMEIKRFGVVHCLENSRKHQPEMGFWREETVFEVYEE